MTADMRPGALAALCVSTKLRDPYFSGMIFIHHDISTPLAAVR